MFPLVRQFQSACDNAKFAAAFTTGRVPPSHPDTEQTFAEVRARIASVLDYLGTFTAADFEGIETREVKRPRWEGKSMRASDYLLEQATPNFFFHLTVAYAILRHNGVDLGQAGLPGEAHLPLAPFRRVTRLRWSSRRITGRRGFLSTTVLNPARAKVEATPV